MSAGPFQPSQLLKHFGGGKVLESSEMERERKTILFSLREKEGELMLH